MDNRISLIAALDEAGGIGKNNGLLCHLPTDLKYFKELTYGKPIVMGRKTYESIGRPLPGRQNIVLSRTLKKEKDLLVVDSVEAVLRETKNAPEVMIIGGREIYELFLPQATTLYLTRIHHRFDADVFFPAMDTSIWREEQVTFQPKDDKNRYDCSFEIHKRKSL